jgi:L-alanine-DL-glutamate epimerase-like enolase superfamily enzyme
MTAAVSVKSWACRVPLDEPLRFRWNTITHRDYTVVEVTMDDGVTGAAIGLSRGAPLDVIVADMFSPVLLSLDEATPSAFQERARKHHAMIDQTGMLAQARSLIDIALWDILATRLQVPLWKLFGGADRNAPVLLVEGYAMPTETDEEFARRLAERVEQGYTALKLEAASYEDPRQLARRLQLLRQKVGDNVQIVIDVTGAWRSVRTARSFMQPLEEFGLAWLEDPFPHSDINKVGELRKHIATPVATGDDITDPAILLGLTQQEAVDVLRVDTTTLGGVQATFDATANARLTGVPISTHCHTPIHQHFSYMWPETNLVEAFPDDRSFEPSYKLLEKSVFGSIQDGHLRAPQDPGVGYQLAHEQVRQWATRSAQVPS